MAGTGAGRIAWVIGLGAALLAGASALLLRDSAPDSPRASALPPTGELPAAGAALEPALPEAGAPAEAVVRELEESFEALTDSALPSPPLEIRVVDAATKQPVAGARVDFAIPQHFSFAENAEFEHSATVAEDRGTAYRADGRGIVVLPGIPRQFVASASDGGRFARSEFHWRDSSERSAPRAGVVLELERDQSLEVRAAYVSGQPCPGIELGLAVAGRDRKGGWSVAGVAWRGTAAGPGATVEVRHVQWYRHRPFGRSLPRLETLVVVPELHLRERVPTPIGEEDLARGRLTVLLPPGSALRVVPETPDGAPFLGKAAYWVEGAGRDSAFAGLAVDCASGEFFVPWVPAGVMLSVTAVPCDRSFLPSRTQVAGSSRSGEAVAARLRFQARNPAPPSELFGRPVVAFRALNASGGAVGGARVRWSLESAESGRPGSEVDSGAVAADASGRVRIELAGSVHPERTATLALALDGGHESAATTLDLSGRALPGVLELGDVAFDEFRISLAGVVVDTGRAAVPGARVIARELDGGDLDVVQTDAHGHFSLVGRASRGRIALTAELGTVRSASVEVPIDAEDARLVLDVPAVRGRLIGAPASCLEGLRVHVRSGAASAFAVTDAAGRFSIRSPPRRACALSVFGPGDAEPLVILRDLYVDERGGCSDERLERVDLQGRVHPVRLRVRAPDGSIPQGCEVLLLGRGASSQGAKLRLDANGELVLVRYRLPLAVSIRGGAAFATQNFADVDADIDVVLQPRSR